MKITDLSLKNLGVRLLMGFLAICPIFYDPSKNFGLSSLRIHQEQFFQIGTIALFSVILIENIYLVSFFLWCVGLYIFFNFPAIGSNYILNMFYGLMLYHISYGLMNEDRFRSFGKVMLWLCFANVVFLIAQMAGVELLFMRAGQYTADYVGLMGLKCFMGMFFAMSVPVMAYFNWKLTPALFVPIYLSQSSVAVVGGVAAFLFSVYFKSKKAFFALLAVCLIAGSLFVFKDTKTGMFHGRFEMWRVVMRDAMKHPITGWGLDSFRHMGEFKPFMYMQNGMTLETRALDHKTLRIIQETKTFPPGPNADFVRPGDALNPWDHPHNEFISIFYEIGVVGIALFIALIADIVRRFDRSPEHIAILGLFISVLVFCTGQFPFHVVRLAVFLPVALAAYYKLSEIHKQEELEVYGAQS